MRLKTTVTAAALSVALAGSTFAVPEASAQAQGGPITLSSLQIGADAAAVNFAWRTTYLGDEFVRYYKTSEGPESAETVRAHWKPGAARYRAMHASISGLEPGTQYSYELGSEEGGWSGTATFTTQSASDSWNFLAFSDAQIGASHDNVSDGAGWQQTLTNATQAYPDSAFIFHDGDQVNAESDPVLQYEQFLAPDELDQYPLAVSKGNHELLLDLGQHFHSHFNLPNARRANYHFERNNALFVVLDSNQPVSAMEDNVRRMVKAHGAGKDWIIVGFHYAPHSYGGRYDEIKQRVMRKDLGATMSELGVDLVLNGHDHMYNRSHLMDGGTPVVPENPAQPGDVLHPQDGEVLYLTMNSPSGSKFYKFKGNDGQRYDDMTPERARELGLEQPTIAYFSQDRTPDYTAVEITPDTLVARTHNSDGTLVDEVTLDHRAPSQPGEGDPSDTNDTDTAAASAGSSTGGIVAVILALFAVGLGAAAVHFQPQIRDMLANIRF